MIKLKDLITEAKLTPYQIFAPGTGGGNFKFNPSKVPTGQLKIYSSYDLGGQCFNKPYGVFWTSSYKQKFKGSHWTDYKKKRFPSWHSSMGAVFELTGSPKILKIRSQKDYDNAVKKYGIDTSDMGCGGGQYYLKWHEIAKHYDGFQLASIKFIPGVHEWDVESTAWFNMKKLKFVGTTKV